MGDTLQFRAGFPPVGAGLRVGALFERPPCRLGGRSVLSVLLPYRGFPSRLGIFLRRPWGAPSHRAVVVAISSGRSGLGEQCYTARLRDGRLREFRIMLHGS